ncbi:hypothetical protein GOP47_0017386 [Adiantum capillus-veneris]|uniref:Uncharacterized protein n=1 Tax=Adiantum capillus-veneris TaxID=13818 RepID=A0A9D4UG45_ADICA|nr:hypothetical protein GOP47_0017386 [Adiantum capillus-veneris]
MEAAAKCSELLRFWDMAKTKGNPFCVAPEGSKPTFLFTFLVWRSALLSALPILAATHFPFQAYISREINNRRAEEEHCDTRMLSYRDAPRNLLRFLR